MQSVREHHPEVDRYIILSDAMHKFTDIDVAANVISCDQMNIVNIENMKIWYTVIEFNTSIKPYSFLYFFEQFKYTEICYIDPDILLLQPLREVFWALNDHSCVLTPHMMHPLQDGKEPSDLTIMKSGIYNLGFLGLKNDGDALRLCRWWADRCYDGCRVDIPGNRFTDQRWMDLAPAFVSRPYILRHPGYNVAYWNLAQRTVSYADNAGWQVDGEPLVFFHFSGIKPDDMNVFSKHTNRFVSGSLGVVEQLCKQYRERVLENKWKKYSTIPYAFGVFANGRPIDDAMRHWISRIIEEGLVDKNIPVSLHSDFFDEVDEFALERGARLTRYMHQFWLDRKDLRNAFDIFLPEGLSKYYKWFTNDEYVRKTVDGRTLFAVESLHAGGGGTSKSRATRRMPPWTPISTHSWSGSAKHVFEFLSNDVVATLPKAVLRVPRMAALLWEIRQDLNQYFELNSVESIKQYLVWFLTDGARQAGLNLSVLTFDFIAEFTAVSDLTEFYGDVPLTDGLLMSRKIGLGRTLPAWEKFPVEKTSRISHGIWFSMTAPHLFTWPEALVRGVLDYFRKPTKISLDGYPLNRATIGIWEVRPDLQSTYILNTREGVAKYVFWLLIFGLQELRIDINTLDPDLAAFLGTNSLKYPKLERILELVYDDRPDVREKFDVATYEGAEAFRKWSDYRLQAEYDGALKWLDSPRSAVGPRQNAVERIEVVLTGYWRVSSGRGEAAARHERRFRHRRHSARP